MDPVRFPAVRPFEVWFMPEEGGGFPARVPLRIGQRLLHYDASVDLANDVARELPAYGLYEGSILVVWSCSGLKVLNTVRILPSMFDAAPRRGATVSGAPRPETVRLVLEDLQQLTDRNVGIDAAPADWIERLHAVLRIIASPEDRARFRLDGSQGITMEVLHRRVSGVLYLVDRLATASQTQAEGPARVVPFARDSG